MFRKINFLLIVFFFFSLGASEEYFVVFLVNARKLDYSNSSKFIKTVAKHPSDLSKNGDVGHAWIYLKGFSVIEGGHSGELGLEQPRYMEGVMDNAALKRRNPISYLWCSQKDGFFQAGNGGHDPTFAAKVSLTKSQYESICSYIACYSFEEYSLTGQQCCFFIREIAKCAGIHLEDQVTLKIDPYLAGHLMWQDAYYEYLTFGSPDRLEVSLKQLVAEKKAENALKWYRKTHQKCFFCRLKKAGETLSRFPDRFLRYFLL